MQFRRLLHLANKTMRNFENRMEAWQIHDYGDLSQLKNSHVRIPIIEKPKDVLVKIKAASVNPIDIAMIRGYGSKVLNTLRLMKERETCIEFPLILGRDFSGTVVGKGHEVDDRLKLGDDVWGVVPVEKQGCHAQYVIIDNNLVNRKPSNLSDIEAASILYAGLTAWSSLWITGGLCYKSLMPNFTNKKILIIGGSGGVGTLAIQIAKAWKLYVVATCNSDAIEMLQTLGADVIIDYKQNDVDSKIKNEGAYDIILDCSKEDHENILKKNYTFNTYITLNSPLLRNVDNYGMIGGLTMNVTNLIKTNLMSFTSKKSCVKWGFFVPSRTGIDTLRKLVENKQVIPVIDKIYSFDELPEAYKRVTEGHLRGKIVIQMES